MDCAVCGTKKEGKVPGALPNNWYGVWFASTGEMLGVCSAACFETLKRWRDRGNRDCG